MSTEQSLDPNLIEQTKRQIQSLVAEIAQLAKSDVSPEEFYPEFLTKIVSALAAVGGAVWTLDGEAGQLALKYQINLHQTNLQNDEEGQKQHFQLLRKSLTGTEPFLVPAHSGAAGEDGEVGNPTDFLLLFGPLRTDLETVGVVEILQRPDTGINTQKGYIRFLGQMCELAADYIKSHQLRHFSDRQALWTRLEEFTRVAHATLDPRLTAYTIANEGRRLIECDRVSVAIKKGRKCQIEAVSGQDLFDKRSNLIRLLGRLAQAVVASEEPMWYTGDTSDMAPQVEDAVQEYVDESHSKTVAVLPLKRPEISKDEQDPDKPEDPEEPIGAIIVEQIENSRVSPSMRGRVEVVCDHSSVALANALEHHSLFLMPVWRLLGKASWLVKARTLPKTVAVTVGVLALIGFLCFFPADFNLESKGTLEPVLQRDVFANIGGVVEEVYVKDGQQVKEGQLLATLRNIDLEVAKDQVLGDIATTHKQIASTQRTVFSDEPMREEERNRLRGELASLRQKLISLNEQKRLYEEKEKYLKVVSPLDGKIVEFDVDRDLIRRPVQQGQRLMRVADPDGEWELELNMAEDRMGHIADAREKIAKDLPVKFILATDPDVELDGTIKQVAESAEVTGEEGNTVTIRVAIDKSQLPHIEQGATVTGKVYCGKRSLGYVWLHDAVAFIYSKILFRL